MIYVDPLMKHGWILRGKPVKSCHLFSDDRIELARFIEKIGVKSYWRHCTKRGFFHFDLTAGKRRLAVKNGAKELSRREAVKIIKEIFK